MSKPLTLTEFNPLLSEHLKARRKAKSLCALINASNPNEFSTRQKLYQQLFGTATKAFIEPHFFCDYGYNIFFGDNFFANHNCILLDAAEIHIGTNVLLGPNVHLYTTTHPTNSEQRKNGMQLIAPIVIEDDVWIGGNSVVMPGVTIGKGSVIGANSVVTKCIPDHVVAVGAPCKVIRSTD